MSKIKCWICGGEATKTRQMESKWGELVEVPVSQYSRCYCERCAKEVTEKEKKERDLYIHLKKREMFLKACNILESQHTDMYAYREAIDVVEEFVGMMGSFLRLTENGINTGKNMTHSETGRSKRNWGKDGTLFASRPTTLTRMQRSYQMQSTR